MGRLLQRHANGPRADVKRPITLASSSSDSDKRKKLGDALDFRSSAGRSSLEQSIFPQMGEKGKTV